MPDIRAKTVARGVIKHIARPVAKTVAGPVARAKATVGARAAVARTSGSTVLSRATRRVVTAMGHYAAPSAALMATATVIVMICTLPLRQVSPRLDSMLSWSTPTCVISEIVAALSALAAVGHWRAATCWRCLAAWPLDAASEIEHFAAVLRIYHRRLKLTDYLGIAFAVCAAIAAMVLGNGPTRAIVAVAVVDLAAGLALFAYATHRRVALWCSQCPAADSDETEEFSLVRGFRELTDEQIWEAVTHPSSSTKNRPGDGSTARSDASKDEPFEAP